MTEPAAPSDLLPFNGAKAMLVHDGKLLTYLRDDKPTIPFPAFWDLPGGGREGGESPLDCVTREIFEEFGLEIDGARLAGHSFPSHHDPAMISWFFTGTLRVTEVAAIRLGDEGQEWRMMPVAEFAAHPLAVPHFRALVAAAAGAVG